MKTETLNAGCGDSSWGSVRIDLDPEAKGITEVMDICHLAYPNKHFEETKCISVLEHIPDWKKAISELCRVTNYLLIMEIPVNSNILLTDSLRILFPTPKNIRLFKNRKERAKETFHQFDPKEVRKEIRKHNFDVVYSKVYMIYHSYPSRCWRFWAFNRKPRIERVN